MLTLKGHKFYLVFELDWTKTFWFSSRPKAKWTHHRRGITDREREKKNKHAQAYNFNLTSFNAIFSFHSEMRRASIESFWCVGLVVSHYESGARDPVSCISYA